MTTYTFEYSKAFTRCKMLSSYEGRDEVGSNGESLYPVILITEQDEEFVRKQAQQAAHIIEDKIGGLIASTAYTDSQFTWKIEPVGRWNGQRLFDKNVEEAISSYVMSVWIVGKKEGKGEFYASMFTEMCNMIKRNLFTKGRPTI